MKEEVPVFALTKRVFTLTKRVFALTKNWHPARIGIALGLLWSGFHADGAAFAAPSTVSDPMMERTFTRACTA
ncbi:MAG: hypothetical protein CMI03_13360 [Oceanospirillaceae bacterium]|nr:hypothetical protein [Thalassolituus sp.]MAS25060.1 hypothetical protein [Oceanospirillaceae bacterium]MBL36256.1 hypothetical protein [Oceanospirillaceae bacterium]MBS53725.1 hypothetical protein [Oceanospirillaceae bacterium]